ncbi:MAG: antibiotic biosynthesis monooxygenase [Desulfobacterales bacterium]
MSLAGQTGIPPIQINQTADEKPVRVGIRLLIPADKCDEVMMILNSVTELVRLEEGCISCRLYQDLHEDGALMLEQLWSSRIHLERHLRTDSFHTVLLVIEMASEYPGIRIDVIAQTTGMEEIQRIRG